MLLSLGKVDGAGLLGIEFLNLDPASIFLGIFEELALHFWSTLEDIFYSKSCIHFSNLFPERGRGWQLAASVVLGFLLGL